MDVSEELALFRNTDFGVVPNTANEDTEKTRLRMAKDIAVDEQNKTERKRKKRKPQIAPSQLDPSELLFFPEHLNVRTRDEIPPTTEEKHREQMYRSKITKMTDAERRQLRAKRDIRYLHKQNQEPKASEPSKADLPCLHHVSGRCEHKVCLFNHQMRLPRHFGVCRFYLMNACTKGVACSHMHSEFPCKFFYLGMPHSNNVDADNCRFTHGDVLNESTKRLFLKQIEFWVKEKTTDNAAEFDRQMGDMRERFEKREQEMLSERRRQQEMRESCDASVNAISASSKRDSILLGEILNVAQIRRLAADNITSVDQLRRLSVVELENYRLTVDQIYEVKSMRFEEQVEEGETCVEELNASAADKSLDLGVDGVKGGDEGSGDETAKQSPGGVSAGEDESDENDSDNERRLVIDDVL